MHNYILNNINDGDNSVMSSSTDNISVINFIHDDTGNMDAINSIIPDGDDQEIIDEYFNSLYLQYIQDIRELEDIEITNQINIICTEQHNKYLANINTSEQENGSDKSIDGSKKS